MLHLVLTVLLIDEPQPAQYTATALSAAQIFEREKSSVGDLESGGYEIDSHGSGGGVTVKTKEVRSGDDYRVDQENGLVHTSYGYYHGQAWSQSANGAVILSSRFRESLDTPGARAFQHPDDPASGVKVLGITSAVPQQLVVEVHPNDGNDQYRYYDPKTCLLQRVVTYTKSGATTVFEYSDYRTIYGRTMAFHTHYSDGKPQNDWDTGIDSFVKEQQTQAGGVPVPRPLFTVAGDQGITLPVRFTPRGIVVTAKSGGRDVNFLLDSGSTEMVIDPGDAHALGATSLGRFTVNIGGAVDRSQTVLPSLDVGSLHMQNVAFAEYPFQDSVLGMHISGLLGFDFIASSVMEIDFKKEQVTVYRRGKFDPEALGLTPLQVQLDDGVPRVAASFEGLQGSFILDTGSFGTFLYEHYVNKLPAAPMAVSEQRGFYAIGGYNAADVRSVSDLVFGGIHYRSLFVLTPRGSNFEFTGYDGIFGRDTLADYQIYFDYEENAVYVKPNL